METTAVLLGALVTLPVALLKIRLLLQQLMHRVALVARGQIHPLVFPARLVAAHRVQAPAVKLVMAMVRVVVARGGVMGPL